MVSGRSGLASNTGGGFFGHLFSQRSNKPLAEVLLANKREGIQTLLVVYVLILDIRRPSDPINRIGSSVSIFQLAYRARYSNRVP
ncbi:hypothetical protein VNO80_33096 [Phaseolus coccineus]|uniref:Uncharacterized protein n=1 Tax=Phaseolus coccineus TaxID=3886 RepID=A0AAN9KYZ8_PHACN